MTIRYWFLFAMLGIFLASSSVFFYNQKPQPNPPLSVHVNPYDEGIYTNAIVETEQVQGSNIQIYPVVNGRVTDVFFKEGDRVKKGQIIYKIYDGIQKQSVEKDDAQVSFEEAKLNDFKEQLQKLEKSYQADPKSISLNQLDIARNAVTIETQNLNMVRAQQRLDLALLKEYAVKSPVNGSILRLSIMPGGYVASQGVYDPYTQAFVPTVQLGTDSEYLHARCFVDELLVSYLPESNQLEASLFLRGDDHFSIPLEFVNIQPYTIPNLELSNEKAQRVDVRVLPVIFKFKKPKEVRVFPGQLVDVYIKGKK